MNKNEDNTQINEKLGNVITYKKIGNYVATQYGGMIVQVPYSDFLQFRSLGEKLQSAIKENEEKEEIIKGYKNENEKLKSQYAKLLNQAKDMESTYKNALKIANEKLMAFTNNQKGGKTKFTVQMKAYVLEMILRGESVTQAYNQMMSYFKYPDISYETVRRFVSEQRSK